MKTQYYAEEEIRQDAMDKLKDGIGKGCYGCDLHNELFNTDYYIIGTYQAKKWLGDMAFDVINIVKEYEQGNFGECNTDLSNPEKVVNMYAYIVGEAVLNDCTELGRLWDDRLTEENVKDIIEELS